MSDHWTDHAAEPVFDTVIHASGPSANILVIVGTAGGMLRRLRVPSDRITKLYEDVMNAASYDQAIAFVEHWFPVERE